MKITICLFFLSLILIQSTLSQEEKTGALDVLSNQNTKKVNGLTWGKVKHDPIRNIDLVGCYGNPKPDNNNGCNAYNGDTDCRKAFPILCIKKNDTPRPNYRLKNKGYAMVKEYYRGWAEGRIELTPPTKGFDIKCIEHANNICSGYFGAGYQMAEFHDGKWIRGMGAEKFYGGSWAGPKNEGGWNFWAYGNISNEFRFWIYIRDQQANCWVEVQNTAKEGKINTR